MSAHTHFPTPDSLRGRSPNGPTPGACFLLAVWNNDNDLQVVDAVSDEYAVIHTIKTKEGVSETLNSLYSKSGFNEEVKDLATTLVGLELNESVGQP